MFDENLTPVKLVYILGFGRSGSTLLDMLLGSLDGVHSVGEVWALGKWILENRNCSCGKPVSRCPIWSNVVNDIQNSCSWTAEDLYYQNEHRRRRLVEVMALVCERFLVPYSQTEVTEFAQREYRVFRKLGEVTKADLFVDSSKHLDRLSRLMNSGYFDIWVIHLVRDGRALLEAARRARQRGVLKKRVVAPRLILGWAIQALNQLQFLEKMVPSDRLLRVDYHWLAQDPASTMATVCDFLGISWDASVVDPDSDRYVFRQFHHLIGGNRLTASPPDTKIRYDSSWQKRLRKFDQLWFAVLSGHAINRRLGVS